VINWFGKLSGGALSAVLALAALPAQAQGQEPIVVAMSYTTALDGDLRGYGVVSGFKAYFGQVNAAGGINGHPLVLESFDDRGDPRLAAEGLRKLVTDKGAVAIIGCVGDAVCATSAATAAALHVPLIGALSGTADLARSRNPYVYSVRADLRHEIGAIAAQLMQLGCTRVAVLTDAPAGQETETTIMSLLQARGLKASAVRVASKTPAGLAEALHTLGASNYQAVLMSVAPHTIDLFADARLADRDEWPRVLMASANGDLAPLIANFKGRVIGFTQVVPNAELLATALARDLNSDADKYGGPQAVTPQGMEGYLGARLLVSALRKSRPKYSSAALVDALNTFDDLPLQSFHLSFRQGRETGSDWVEIGVRSRDGTLVN
jgi:branched-chain amino acid transport system substrate-binding protein